jgi:hypothetical protein
LSASPDRKSEDLSALAHKAATAVIFLPERDIQGAELLTPIFQGWPCFHDAEILRLTLQREPRMAFMECVVHVFNRGHDEEARSPSLPPEHTLVTIRFEDIDLEQLKDFNQQNVIDDLRIEVSSENKRCFTVDVPANNGCDMTFSCEAIRIVSVQPYTIDQRIRDGSVYVKG